MLSGVNRAAGGAQASANNKAQLEAKRQEILKSAQEQGGTQARAVRTGQRQAEGAQRFRTTAPTGGAQGGGTTTSTGGTTANAQTQGASAQGKSAQSTNPGAGWRDRIKRWDAKEEPGKGTQVDVTA